MFASNEACLRMLSRVPGVKLGEAERQEAWSRVRLQAQGKP